MASSKAKDLRGLSDADITRRIRENKLESINLKLQKATGALQNTARVRTLRRENALLLTLRNEAKNKA
jgi:large subunit ribosomal protein L29